MKKIITIGNVLIAIVLVLFVANVVVFYYQIRLSDRVHYYEKEIIKYDKENKVLSHELNSINSLGHAASEAAKLDFDRKANPIYLDPLPFALR